MAYQVFFSLKADSTVIDFCEVNADCKAHAIEMGWDDFLPELWDFMKVEHIEEF